MNQLADQYCVTCNGPCQKYPVRPAPKPEPSLEERVRRLELIADSLGYSQFMKGN